MASTTIFPKGSEWRKWDLQIHCPDDVLNNQYAGRDSNEKWNQYLSALEKSDLKAIAVTNYFCIKGYKNILGYKKRGRIPKIALILPNIEFRITQPNKKGEQINLHVIFSEKEDLISKIEGFLNRLPLICTTAEKKKLYCSDDDLKRASYSKALIDFNTLDECLRKDFEPLRDYIIVGVPRGHGSFRPDGEEGRGVTIAEEIDKISHAFFGTTDDVSYFLNAQRYKDAVQKPVISTSDAHELDKIGSKFSWIKADSSFEGLKQIIFEPQERIRIQIEKPEDKKTYFIIDKVRFIDNCASSNFPSDYIEINPNLTTIIGGRSTGKSLLLHYIAKTIDVNEVLDRVSERSKYRFDDNPNFNFEVTWGDGEKTLLKSLEEEFPPEEEKRKILYIPQNYLNRLSEVDIKSKETLNQFIVSVILQDEKLKAIYTIITDEIKLLEKGIPNKINEVFSLLEENKQLEEDIKQLGDLQGIESYIKKLEGEAGDIKSKSGLSKEEISKYESCKEIEKDISTILANLEADKKTVENMQGELLLSAKSILQTKAEYLGYINDLEISEKIMESFKGIDNIEKDIHKATEKILSSIETKRKKIKSEQEKIKEELAPITSKITLQSELEKKSLLIKSERDKIDKINLLKKYLKHKNDTYEKRCDEAIGDYRKINEKYDELRNNLKVYENKFQDISLNIVVGFNVHEFNALVVDEFLNKQTLKRIGDINWREEFEYQYDPMRHLDDIKRIYCGILDGKVGVLKDREKRDALMKLLENKFYLDFGITYKDDPLEKMSPGKKGLVLLKLLIELSNDEWPILLDQPDDDLDNRSIYVDLVSFILRKKKDRQIIFITHNPNLVVGADAEEVIVSNQAGQETGRDNRKFRFEYVSGSLENTFELNVQQEKAILYRKGIRQHVYEILEGGKEAFQKREQKYSFSR